MADELPGAPAPSTSGCTTAPASPDHQAPSATAAATTARSSAPDGPAVATAPAAPVVELDRHRLPPVPLAAPGEVPQPDANGIRWFLSEPADQAPEASGLGLDPHAPTPPAGTTSPTTREPTPHELLRLMDGWLSAFHYGADHPWRLSIARTLAEYPDPGPMRPRSQALEALLYSIADRAVSVQNMIDATSDDDIAGFSQAIRTQVGVIGWLADRGLHDHCDRRAGMRGDVAQWLLHSVVADQLKVPGGAA